MVARVNNNPNHLQTIVAENEFRPAPGLAKVEIANTAVSANRVLRIFFKTDTPVPCKVRRRLPIRL